MLNQFMIVGKIDTFEIESKNLITLTLRVRRKEKDENNKDIYDIVKIELIGEMAKAVKEYCNKDDIIGIRGSIQTDKLIAEEVKFLSTRKKEE